MHSSFRAGFYEMQPMQQQYMNASSSASHIPQILPGVYPGQTANNSTLVQDPANFMGQTAPLEVSGFLQFSNGTSGPQGVVAADSRQQQPLQQLPYIPPSSPAFNSTPYLRQGVSTSLGNSSSRISQKFELPPLPRPVSSAAAVAEDQPNATAEFKPAVYAPPSSLATSPFASV
jgi:hypothetical protein